MALMSNAATTEESTPPDLSEAELEARYGLPAHVQFCRECVMSNQKPNSCYELSLIHI